MLHRSMSKAIMEAAEYYPVIAIIGPRQSGKTTLSKTLFSTLPYVSLEDIDMRETAQNDPRGFLELYKEGAILDEAQHCPELFSYLQTLVDQSSFKGQFVLTGSQNFLLHEKITQSLAGRVSLHTLLPLSFNEITLPGDYHELILRGFYPKLHCSTLKPSTFYSNYVRTYLERDVRTLLNVTDLSIFSKFIRLCAGHVGQLINYSALATACSISYKTVQQWISILKASYIITTLPPYYKNNKKRLVKQEKLYFCDVGLAAHLLNITTLDHLLYHPLKGALFENMIVLDLYKNAYEHNKEQSLFFWRDSNQNELDIIIEKATLVPIEIKAGKTFIDSFLKNHNYWARTMGQSEGYIIYGGRHKLVRDKIKVIPWSQIAELMTEFENQ